MTALNAARAVQRVDHPEPQLDAAALYDPRHRAKSGDRHGRGL
ncbi:hypothetical protein [Methylobacterium sp. CM6257]